MEHGSNSGQHSILNGNTRQYIFLYTDVVWCNDSKMVLVQWSRKMNNVIRELQEMAPTTNTTDRPTDQPTRSLNLKRNIFVENVICAGVFCILSCSYCHSFEINLKIDSRHRFFFFFFFLRSNCIRNLR